MSTREIVLYNLIASQNSPVSGQTLASQIGLSRNAIWKAVEELRNQGYIIEQEGRRGYLLKSMPKSLDSLQIGYYGRKIFPDLYVEIHQQVTSTNDVAKQFAQNNPGQPALFIAKEQTKGRGRYGRSFFSGLHHGLYLSLVLQPHQINIEDTPLYTLLAASSMAKALDPYLESPIQIKWINDLFYKQGKVAGILCESIMDLETQSISSLIIGIGLNLAGDFSKQDPTIQSVAGTLFGQTLPASLNQNQLLTDFLTHFALGHQNLPDGDFLKDYQKRLLGLNQQVYYEKSGQRHEGIIRGINSKGNLLVEDFQGDTHLLLAGEIHFSSHQFTKLRKDSSHEIT